MRGNNMIEEVQKQVYKLLKDLRLIKRILRKTLKIGNILNPLTL